MTNSSFHFRSPSSVKEAKGATHFVLFRMSGTGSPLLSARRTTSFYSAGEASSTIRALVRWCAVTGGGEDTVQWMSGIKKVGILRTCTVS